MIMDLEELIAQQNLAVVDRPKFLEAYIRSRGWADSTVSYARLDVVQKKGTDFRGILHPFPHLANGCIGYQIRWPRNSKMRWSGGGTLSLYNEPGLQCVNSNDRVLVICEGVSDTLSVIDTWGADCPVVGVPGASWISESHLSEQANRLKEAVRRNRLNVVVVPDNDEAGSGFVQKIRALRGDLIAVLRVPNAYNDFTEWRTSSPDFIAELGTAIHEMGEK